MIDAANSAAAGLPSASRLDVSVFIATFLGGMGSYFLLRSLDAPQLLITACLVVLMLGYAFSISRLPRLRLRLDQTGDNTYYLGLLFTLMSMATALHEFGLADLNAVDDTSTRQIIADFGIALATTIAGIFLRVVLHQMRIDPAQIEATSRLELSDAATRVRGILDNVSVEMEQLIADVRQRADDNLRSMLDDAGHTFADLVSQVSGATSRLTTAASDAHNEAISRMSDVSRRMAIVADEVEGTAGRLRSIEAPPARFASRLEKVSESMTKLATDAETATRRLADVVQMSAQASDKLGSVAVGIAEAGRANAHEQRATADRLNGAVDQLRKSLSALGGTIDEDREKWAAFMAQSLRGAEAARDTSEASTVVLDNLVKVTRGLTDLMRAKV